ncbi:uncharacterized protein LOC121382832 [Gigantopelta aegis]|uniref:uncharacterized protein LOC121382832 n=1 Tax=Gigantopelta aegis TaxID=1735272 RepID=UPI001B88E40A|nr:uncharacterized protein LOC121382832 [Gigantopelta aegis]
MRFIIKLQVTRIVIDDNYRLLIDCHAPASHPKLSALKCPSCWKVNDVTICSQKSQICDAGEDVCVGNLEEWKFSVTCSTSLLCPINDLIGWSVNCTGGVAFRPHDECTSCCSGPDCDDMLNAVQRGFDAIPTVLHCPTCAMTSDPRDCMNNILPCDVSHDTCEIDKQGGLYSGKCKSSHTCKLHQHTHPNFPACFQGQTAGCTICCKDGTCIRQAYGVLMSTSTPPTTSSPGITPHPEGCTDAAFHPCSIKNDSCADPLAAMAFCERTCNMCPGEQSTTSTTHSSVTPPISNTPSTSCVDSDEFHCTEFPDICRDHELAMLHCPRMCKLCP